jgi:hypothetical protein
VSAVLKKFKWHTIFHGAVTDFMIAVVAYPEFDAFVSNVTQIAQTSLQGSAVEQR